MDEPQEQVAITPHTLRHTAAMRLLHAGVDITVIALWLGHESPRPPRSTSTPTSPSRNARSHAPPPQHAPRPLPAARPAARLPGIAVTIESRTPLERAP
jgi:hypothetical protein